MDCGGYEQTMRTRSIGIYLYLIIHFISLAMQRAALQSHTSAGIKGHASKFGQRPSMRFPHYGGAVVLDSSLANTEVGSYILTWMASKNHFHDFELALCKNDYDFIHYVPLLGGIRRSDDIEIFSDALLTMHGWQEPTVGAWEHIS